jgi:hypothetical protein
MPYCVGWSTWGCTVNVRPLISYAGHRGRELLLHMGCLTQAADLPRLMIMPSVWGAGSSSDLRGVAVGRALKKLGWRVSVVPPQLEWQQRQRAVDIEKPDVIMFQQSRHPHNRPQLYPGIPCVLDADDADILDAAEHAVAAECCEDSACVIVGNTFLASAVRPYNANTHVVWTSTHLPYVVSPSSVRARRPIITWAQLHATSWKLEAELVREMLARVARRAQFEFLLIGEDDLGASSSYMQDLQSVGVTGRAVGRLAYRSYIRELGNGAIGLNPSSQASANGQGRSFGKVLGYIAARVAVVTANVGDYPQFFRHGSNSLLAGETDVAEWAEHCVRLLNDADLRVRLTEQALQDLRQRLTTEAAAKQVDGILRQVLVRSITAPH